MNEGVMIFGGVEELRKKIIEVKRQKPEVIFILTTCPSGIIGDDVKPALELEDAETKIIPIMTDGNLQGDYLQGIIMAYMEIGRALIDRTVEAEDNTINLVAEKPETNSRAASAAFVSETLGKLGISVNCHFICESSTEEIRRFKRGKLNILAYADYMGRTVRKFLEDEYGARFLDRPLPTGFDESAAWLRKTGAYFNKDEKLTQSIIGEYETRYNQEMRNIRPFLAGKRLMVIAYNQDMDWIFKTALDAGMEIAFAGIADYSQDNSFHTIFADRITELHASYDRQRRREDLIRVKPDLYLSNYGSKDQELARFSDTIQFCPPAGFFTGLDLARRWAAIFKMNLAEGWRKDEALYRKYRA
jgi:nitrogenase molybdenum-iron protein alpha/beta subunit